MLIAVHLECWNILDVNLNCNGAPLSPLAPYWNQEWPKWKTELAVSLHHITDSFCFIDSTNHKHPIWPFREVGISVAGYQPQSDNDGFDSGVYEVGLSTVSHTSDSVLSDMRINNEGAGWKEGCSPRFDTQLSIRWIQAPFASYAALDKLNNLSVHFTHWGKPAQ